MNIRTKRQGEVEDREKEKGKGEEERNKMNELQIVVNQEQGTITTNFEKVKGSLKGADGSIQVIGGHRGQ